MTFSIVARCKATGQLGAAVSSSSPAVAARCIRAKAGVGVAASQNITDPNLAHILLDLIKYDVSAADAIQELVANTDFIEYRQLLVLNAQGQSACFSGEHTLGIYQSYQGQDVACAGNLLANPDVPKVMCEAFEYSQGALAERLLIAMQAGLAAGGEAGPVHSAGMLVVDKVDWPVVDLRVDWSDDDPIAALSALWKMYAPQVEDYVLRALNPASSPSYGVAGDP
ncbi:DUF1028 domain-containing protein [Acinetobacter sp. MD2]|uniref:DUF1028 domain-containing protein n=1 Tax=Acinetobacter sp. MD2 TaxID=2600066 RepID=UPI002D1EC835|nr:DUF1028 domain-containing protein [Acinetobacter sp. MD2]MEB3766495.1 DUF1028 domain-containing protein [Acinetobacter sp. MD2]